LDETTPEVFHRMMSINVLAPLLLTQHAARLMRKQRIQVVVGDVDDGDVVVGGGGGVQCW
jgi:NAD(P)-dependent dehydrogenase (short-subunit alcohol dehydrogenase family)